MSLLDDRGRLFGTVNIIDTLAILLVLAVTAASTAFVLGVDGESTPQPKTAVTLQTTGVQPYVADAIPEGPAETDGIASVDNKSVRPTEVTVRDQNGTLHQREHPRQKTVTLQVSLNTTTADGEVWFENEQLEIGRELTLDLGAVTVTGNVIHVSP